MNYYSVEILADNTIVIQPTRVRLRHGAIGRVLLGSVAYNVAHQIKMENIVTF